MVARHFQNECCATSNGERETSAKWPNGQMAKWPDAGPAASGGVSVGDWDVVTSGRLVTTHLKRLVAGRVAAVVIPDLLSSALCDQIAKQLDSVGFTYYKQLVPPVGKIGAAQSEFINQPLGLRHYFEAAPKARAELSEVFRGTVNLTDFMIKTLQGAWPQPVSPLVDASGEQFVVGVFRDVPGGTLHRDWAPRDAPTWPNGNLSAQIAANIHLVSPRKGGELVVYERSWISGDEELFPHRLPNGKTYGYEHNVVEGVSKFVIEPKVGTCVLINTRNYHEILPVSDGRRLTFSVFAGVDRETNRLALWS